ncbi:MAG: O-methyltransferase [Opitutaceae bacterium]|jgi:predicted O-methyltransferase YrrM
MPETPWSEVDRYFTGLLHRPDAALDAAVADSEAAGLPAIQVSPAQGKLLHLIARIQGAREILEIGTLGGYSTIWLARALAPGGRLITLEIDPRHAAVAGANLARAGLTGIVELRLGPAAESLAQISREGRGPFDLIFIDADKEGMPGYFTWALRLSRAGTVIIVDNVARKGAVIDAASADPAVRGARRFSEMLAAEPRVSATVVQTVGVKGYDGFAILVVNGEPGTAP